VTIDSSADFLAYDGSAQAWRQVAATIATVALACSSGYFTGFMLHWMKREDDEFYEYDDSVYWWEGEFYENVNTVNDLDVANSPGGTAHELSMSGKTIPLAKVKSSAAAPDVMVETA